MPKFSERLKLLRGERGLSQQELSKLLGVLSKSSINMYERGEREPSIETLELIADFFNVDMDYLLGKSDIPNRNADLMDALLKKLAEDAKSGRREAIDKMIQSFGDSHQTSSLHKQGDKVALLYYHAFDNSCCASTISEVLGLIENLGADDLHAIRGMISGYIHRNSYEDQ